MQTLDLNKMGLEPMTEFEMQTVEGGNWLGAIIGAVVGAVVGFVAGGVAGAIEGAIVGFVVGDLVSGNPMATNINSTRNSLEATY